MGRWEKRSRQQRGKKRERERDRDVELTVKGEEPPDVDQGELAHAATSEVRVVQVVVLVRTNDAHGLHRAVVRSGDHLRGAGEGDALSGRPGELDRRGEELAGVGVHVVLRCHHSVKDVQAHALHGVGHGLPGESGKRE